MKNWSLTFPLCIYVLLIGQKLMTAWECGASVAVNCSTEELRGSSLINVVR